MLKDNGSGKSQKSLSSSIFVDDVVCVVECREHEDSEESEANFEKTLVLRKWALQTFTSNACIKFCMQILYEAMKNKTNNHS